LGAYISLVKARREISPSGRLSLSRSTRVSIDEFTAPLVVAFSSWTAQALYLFLVPRVDDEDASCENWKWKFSIARNALMRYFRERIEELSYFRTRAVSAEFATDTLNMLSAKILSWTSDTESAMRFPW